MPRNMSVSSISTIEELLVTLSTPIVLFASAIHLQCGPGAPAATGSPGACRAAAERIPSAARVPRTLSTDHSLPLGPSGHCVVTGHGQQDAQPRIHPSRGWLRRDRGEAD